MTARRHHGPDPNRCRQQQVLQFLGGNGGDFDGAQIQRDVGLAGATAATLSYSIAETGLDGAADNDSITVFFSRDGVTFVQVE